MAAPQTAQGCRSPSIPAVVQTIRRTPDRSGMHGAGGAATLHETAASGDRLDSLGNGQANRRVAGVGASTLRTTSRSPGNSGCGSGSMALFGKKANFRPLQKLEWNEQVLRHIVCFRSRSLDRRKSVVILYLPRRA